MVIFTRKITKNNLSHQVVIPKELMQFLEIDENCEVEIEDSEREDKRILIIKKK